MGAEDMENVRTVMHDVSDYSPYVGRGSIIQTIKDTQTALNKLDFNSGRYSAKNNSVVVATSPTTKQDNLNIVSSLEQQNRNLERQNTLLTELIQAVVNKDTSVYLDGRAVSRQISGYVDNDLRSIRDSKSRAMGGR